MGRSGVYGCLVDRTGQPLKTSRARFKTPQTLPAAYGEVVTHLIGEIGQAAVTVVGLEKQHRRSIPEFPPPLPEIFQPALASSLLGAIPEGPGLLLSLGREIRIAVIDSTNTYREFRFVEGGGEWWQDQLLALSHHSRRLQLHMKDFGSGRPPLKFVPRLLELGQYPTPDPVLKPKLEKVSQQVARMVHTASARLPGLKRYAVSGFLSDSALSELTVAFLAESAPHLKLRSTLFPPELGSALVGLALDLENEERAHLNREPFVAKPGLNDWTPPVELLRRLYRTRKPFQDYHR